jgi:hypothetical protein
VLVHNITISVTQQLLCLRVPNVLCWTLQAVMQHLAGDDFWHSADATSTRLQSPHEVGMNMLSCVPSHCS